MPTRRCASGTTDSHSHRRWADPGSRSAGAAPLQTETLLVTASCWISCRRLIDTWRIRPPSPRQSRNRERAPLSTKVCRLRHDKNYLIRHFHALTRFVTCKAQRNRFPRLSFVARSPIVTELPNLNQSDPCWIVRMGTYNSNRF